MSLNLFKDLNLVYRHQSPHGTVNWKVYFRNMSEIIREIVEEGKKTTKRVILSFYRGKMNAGQHFNANN